MEQSGGEIRLNTVPRTIHVADGRVAGVETSGGEYLRARHFVGAVSYEGVTGRQVHAARRNRDACRRTEPVGHSSLDPNISRARLPAPMIVPRLFQRVSHDVRITVRPVFAPEHSDPAGASWVFVYFIRIENLGDRTIQLRDGWIVDE